jgi:hypothetical protein
LVLGGVDGDELGELGDEGEVGEGVRIEVQVPDLFEVEDAVVQALDLFLGD